MKSPAYTVASILAVVAIAALALAVDLVLYRYRLGTESTTMRAWALNSAAVPWALLALCGHIVHELVPSAHLQPVPAHVAFFLTGLVIALIDYGLREGAGVHIPAEVAGLVGYLAGGGLVGA